MYRELTVEHDKDRLLQYWHDEQRAPRWYRESNEAEECNTESFLGFCSEHTLYEINDSALLYFRKVSPTIGIIHFSVLRGHGRDLCNDLKEIRGKLFDEVQIVYGWIFRPNRPLKKLCRELGLEFNGLMAEIPRLGKKPIVKECFSADKRSFA